MLQFNDYIADWPDVEYPNFIAWLNGIEKQFGARNAILFRAGGQKDFLIWSFTRYAQECRRIAKGLLASGLKKGDRVGLWADNRPEWMAVWMGAAIAGLVIVPIDFHASESECANILRISNSKAFFYSARRQAFVDALPLQGILLTIAICLGRKGNGSYSDFGIWAGYQPLPKPEDIAEIDTASIVFTSGTLGFAKGVMLSHKAIIANANAAILSLRPSKEDVFINVLPLHHSYPTTCSFISPLTVGASTVIVEKIIGKVLIDDIYDSKGTFLIAVPLLYDKIKASIEKSYNEQVGLVRVLLNTIRILVLWMANRGNFKFGRRIFRFVHKKARLESLRIMVAGGGPLKPSTADFFDSFGFTIVHGYGISENSPLVSVNTPRYKRNRSVGLPVKYTEVRILEPDNTGIGEIAVKSPSLMLGYFAQPEATAQMFNEDGFLKTGDLGRRDKRGFIYINGRKKNLIVSAGGKNIYPEEIEIFFARYPLVSEVLIVGRCDTKRGGELVFAVVVPNKALFAEQYPGSDEAFIRETIKTIIEEINRGLSSYKKIADFTIRNEPFEKNSQHKIRRFLYTHYAQGD
ncbi:long-chain-fatty-acid--CoA ligase [Spirochaetia bacterium]|nr:long-chain-fatty-acid--CoA ligase [Spirochaetia bacterium]